MNLRQLACQDAVAILEDGSYGFGWPIVVRNPDGDTFALTGFSNDIGQAIDPDTGQTVSGRQASIALPIARLEASGLDIPRDIPDTDLKPWIIFFDDILGHSQAFKVIETLPDRSIGIVVCLLEFYSFESSELTEPVTLLDAETVTINSGDVVFA